jgi:ketosteroid isomerase-like protein
VNARRIVSYKRQEDGEWLIARQMWNLKPNKR